MWSSLVLIGTVLVGFTVLGAIKNPSSQFLRLTNNIKAKTMDLKAEKKGKEEKKQVECDGT